MSKQQEALDRWLTVFPQEDERPEWQWLTEQEIAQRLDDWHEDHPDWNPDSTRRQRRSDAKHIHRWANQ